MNCLAFKGFAFMGELHVPTSLFAATFSFPPARGAVTGLHPPRSLRAGTQPSFSRSSCGPSHRLGLLFGCAGCSAAARALHLIAVQS